MTSPTPSCSGSPRAARSGAEAGFTLAALIVILTIISVVVAYTVPQQWSLVMKRERERHTLFLMKQYARAIREFQRKNGGALPVSLQQLQDARKPRFLRGDGKWPMPLTGREEDWILVPPNAVAGAPIGGAGAIVPGVPAGGAPRPRLNPAFGDPSAPPPQTPAPAPAPGQGQQGMQPGTPSRLQEGSSPADYVGPFIGVRPNAKGKSLLKVNGTEDYGEWIFTVQDLENEIAMRVMALSMR